MPHRETNALVRVRVTVRPVQLQLALVRIHVPDNRVAVHCFDRLCFNTSEPVRIRRSSDSIHKPHVGQLLS